LVSLSSFQHDALTALGAVLSLAGGALIVMGFRTEYKAWNPKEMKPAAFMEQKPVPQQTVAKTA
jgi:hypothetical protein